MGRCKKVPGNILILRALHNQPATDVLIEIHAHISEEYTEGICGAVDCRPQAEDLVSGKHGGQGGHPGTRVDLYRVIDSFEDETIADGHTGIGRFRAELVAV